MIMCVELVFGCAFVNRKSGLLTQFTNKESWNLIIQRSRSEQSANLSKDPSKWKIKTIYLLNPLLFRIVNSSEVMHI